MKQPTTKQPVDAKQGTGNDPAALYLLPVVGQKVLYLPSGAEGKLIFIQPRDIGVPIFDPWYIFQFSTGDLGLFPVPESMLQDFIAPFDQHQVEPHKADPTKQEPAKD